MLWPLPCEKNKKIILSLSIHFQFTLCAIFFFFLASRHFHFTFKFLSANHSFYVSFLSMCVSYCFREYCHIILLYIVILIAVFVQFLYMNPLTYFIFALELINMNLHGVGAKVLYCNIQVSWNSTWSVTFTFSLMTLEKGSKPLFFQLWVK